LWCDATVLLSYLKFSWFSSICSVSATYVYISGTVYNLLISLSEIKDPYKEGGGINFSIRVDHNDPILFGRRRWTANGQCRMLLEVQTKCYYFLEPYGLKTVIHIARKYLY
jgi:hypothetical protein